jgi:hypothetical protein
MGEFSGNPHLEPDETTPGLWAMSVSHGRWKMASHLQVIDQAFVDAAYVPNTRTIVQLPPRHGKSELCSIHGPAWYMRQFPLRNVMLWSATAGLAQRFSTHVRELVTQDLPLDQSTKSWEHWKLAGTGPNQGEFFAAGIGGGGTMGAGFHLGIIDDYHRNAEDALSENIRKKQQEWFLTSCLTRMEPGASLFIIGTRWHKDDLIGFALKLAEESGEQWKVIRMPAINEAGEALWPGQWPVQDLQRIRSRILLSGYPWMWNALYQQEPTEVLDAEWDPAYFGPQIMYSTPPTKERVRFSVMAHDPSMGNNEKADYAATVKLSLTTDSKIYIDAWIDRKDAQKQVDDLVALGAHVNPVAIGIEVNGFQGVLKQIFHQKCHELQYWPYMYGINTQQDKLMKIRGAVTPFLAQDMLRFRSRSPGCALLLEQLRGFPCHKFNDGPDALAMALQLMHHVLRYGREEHEPQPEYALT